MLKTILNTIRLVLAHYAEQEKQITSIICCLPPSAWVEFNSSLLKVKNYNRILLRKAIIGQPLGCYNYNRQAMQKIIKSLVNNKLIK